MSDEYKTVKTPIDDLTEVDELVATLIQQLGDYRMVRAPNPARDGNRFKYQSLSRSYTINGGEFVELASYFNKRKIIEYMTTYDIDVNHDGGIPRIWTASMINSHQAKYPGIFTQSSDRDPDIAVFKLFLKSRIEDGTMELPL